MCHSCCCCCYDFISAATVLFCFMHAIATIRSSSAAQKRPNSSCDPALQRGARLQVPQSRPSAPYFSHLGRPMMLAPDHRTGAPHESLEQTFIETLFIGRASLG